MYCRFCGKVIRDDASFCSYCGKSAFPIAESKPQSAVLLPMRPAAHETSAAEPNSEPAGTEMVMQPTPMESVPMQPPASEHTGRANMVYNFVSVPADWQCGMNDVVRQAAIAATVSTPQKTNAPTAIPPVRTPTEERTANIAETVKESSARSPKMQRSNTAESPKKKLCKSAALPRSTRRSSARPPSKKQRMVSVSSKLCHSKKWKRVQPHSCPLWPPLHCF